MRLPAIAPPFLLVIAAGICNGQHYLISTFAGGTPPATPAPADKASLPFPMAITTDSAGKTYIVSSHSVFQVDANGILTRIAGNARAGNSGDGGPATIAQLRLDSTVFGYAGAVPPAIAADRSGNVFVADNGNFRIRRISADGIITTVVGTGDSGFSGDGGEATAARISFVLGLATDAAGNIWIADSGNNRIRQVTTDGKIRTIAGNGSCAFSGDNGPAVQAQLCGPTGMAADDSGNLFVTDTGNNRIRRVSPDGTIITVAGTGPDSGSDPFYCSSKGDGGPAIRASLCLPTNVAVDPTGTLFVTDTLSDSDESWQIVRKISPAGTITTVAGGPCPENGLGICDFSYFDDSSPSRTFLGGPVGLAADRLGGALIADPGSFRVRKLSPSGALTAFAGDGSHGYSGDGGPAIHAQMAPTAVAVDRQGHVFLSDDANDRIRKISADGIILTVAGNGTFGSSGDGGAATEAQVVPMSVAVDGAGNIYILDFPHGDVRKVSPNGTITTVAGGDAPGARLFGLRAVAADFAGNLYIASDEGIRKLTPAGESVVISNAKAVGLAADDSGNLFFSVYGRVERRAPDGSTVTVAGNGVGGFSGDGGPATDAQIDTEALAVDRSGNLFLAEAFNNRIRKVSSDGVINTIAGNGLQAYTGDGGPATLASLATPIGLAVDRDGAVYVADSANNAVRVLRPTARPPLRPR
jgi:trimeric autotransporter adhesin